MSILGTVAGLLIMTAFIAREWEIIRHRQRTRRRYRKAFRHLRNR
jgi:hypothetical protein